MSKSQLPLKTSSDSAMPIGQVVEARRIGPIVAPDYTRVLLRPFFPSSVKLAKRMVQRLSSHTEETAAQEIRYILDDFGNRHADVRRFFVRRYDQVRERLGIRSQFGPMLRELIGSCFTLEYSPESAALFNPSMVRHPDQTGLTEGAVRFILSLRATGEGHISSITFRTGVLSAQQRISLSPTAAFVEEPEPIHDADYEKDIFARKLNEAGLHSNFCRRVVSRLPDVFQLDELKSILGSERSRMSPVDLMADRASQGILLLAESNFEVQFDPASATSQRILFPSVPSQSNGIEDARFVQFSEDNGSINYYATYTAYDGKIILPQLLETSDFCRFRFLTLNGPAVQNKGMALFPRKIDGRYAMLSRQDDESIYIMYSDNIHFWHTPSLLLSPEQPWESVKIGVCSSPIETEAGWLVLSHGVGPMRKYSIGAFLLDRENPSKLVGRLKSPLLSPNEAEREGYVPNVVYSCGALLHGRELIIPYAMSDYASSFATVNLDKVLGAIIS